ncbi:hypothetical protein B296_00043467, partial [Ensete ventricosum]
IGLSNLQAQETNLGTTGSNSCKVGRTDGPCLLKSCLELCMAYDSSLLKCFSSLCSHAFPNYSSLTGLTHKIVLDRYLLIGLLPTTDMQ